MITLYDHIQELRAELRGCYFTRSERAAVQAASALPCRRNSRRLSPDKLKAIAPSMSLSKRFKRRRQPGPHKRPHFLPAISRPAKLRRGEFVHA